MRFHSFCGSTAERQNCRLLNKAAPSANSTRVVLKHSVQAVLNNVVIQTSTTTQGTSSITTGTH